MVAAVTADPSVAAVAALSPGLLSQPRAAFASASGRSCDVTGGLPVGIAGVLRACSTSACCEAAYSRSRKPALSAAVAVVSETSAARTIWPDVDAGRSGAAPRGRSAFGNASGAANRRCRHRRSWSWGSFATSPVFESPATRRPASTSRQPRRAPKQTLIARVHGDPERARRALVERLTRIDPNMGMVLTLRTLGRMETYPLQVAFWLTVVLGGLALILTVSGFSACCRTSSSSAPRKSASALRSARRR